jgi:hypothetical protein
MKEQQPLVWSDEAPTEEGYYWWRQTLEGFPVPVRVRLGDGMNCRNLRMYLAGNNNSFGVDWGQWAGPLIPPADGAQEQEWVRLDSLRPGAIFETQEGERGIRGEKSAIFCVQETGWLQLIGLKDDGAMLVREIAIG